MSMTFTLQTIDRTSARVLDALGKGVGHIGLSGAGAYVNGAYTYGFAFVAHTHDFAVALSLFTKAAEKAATA